MNDLYAKITAWLVAATGVTVIRQQQTPGAPQPKRPFILLSVKQSSEIGGERRIDADDKMQMTRWTQYTAGLQIFARPSHPHEAQDVAIKVIDATYFQELADETMGRTVAFNRVISGPQAVDEVLGAEWEPRVILDLSFSASRSVTQNLSGGSVIENVHFSGEVAGQDIKREVSWP